MQDSPISANLFLGALEPIPLDASYHSWRQHTDHRGRPTGKPRPERWQLVTSQLSLAQHNQLLHLMISNTARVDARVEYGRSDGQGQFITIWGTGCYVVQVQEHFDARGTTEAGPSLMLYLALAPEEMGRQAGLKGEFTAPVGRDYAYAAEDFNALTPSSDGITEILFLNNSLSEIRSKIISGDIPRRHQDLISVEEQSIIAYYTTKEGYQDFNLALRGEVNRSDFINAQEIFLNRALSKLPKFTGSVVRGTGATETQRLNLASKGDIIEYKNFVSTSLDEGIADDFMYRKHGEYILRIQSKQGVSITDISLAPAEDEILFSSNSKFRVVDKSYRPRFVEDDPLIKEIYLEQV